MNAVLSTSSQSSIERYKQLYQTFKQEKSKIHALGNNPQEICSTLVELEKKLTALFEQIGKPKNASLLKKQVKVRGNLKEVQSFLFSRSRIDQLPVELLELIFSYGNLRDRLIWAKVCKVWRDLCTTDHVWKPIVESILPKLAGQEKNSYYQLYLERTSPLLNLKNQYFTKTVLIKSEKLSGVLHVYELGIKIQNKLWLKSDAAVVLWTIDTTGMEEARYETHWSSSFMISALTDEDFLYIVGKTAVIFKDLLTGKETNLPIQTDRHDFHYTLFCKKGNLVALAGKDKEYGTIQVWDLHQRTILKTILIDQPCHRLAMENRIVYSLSKDGSIVSYDLSQNRHLPSLKIDGAADEELDIFRVSKGNIFAANLKGKLFIFDARGKQHLIKLPRNTKRLFVEGNIIVINILIERSYTACIFHLKGEKLCTLEKVKVLRLKEKKLLVYDEEEDCIAEWDFHVVDGEQVAVEKQVIKKPKRDCVLQ